VERGEKKKGGSKADADSSVGKSPSGKSSDGRSPAGGGGKSLAAGEDGWRTAFEDRIAELESHCQELKRHDGSSQRSHAETLNRARRNIELLAKFVVGTRHAGTDEGSPTNSDPLMWLEKNRHSTVGTSIDMRLTELEGSADLGGTVTERVHKVESVMGSMDVEYLRKVKPEFQEFKQEQQAFQNDLHREVQELKVLVGCLEACIPRETRKAVELFKRAAGAPDTRPRSPTQMQLEGKILILQDQLETRLKAAEEVVAGQCDRVTTVVRELERKQEQFDSHLASITEKVSGTWRPGSSAQQSPRSENSPRSDKTTLKLSPQASPVRVEWGEGQKPQERRPSRGQILEKAGAAGWSKPKG